MFDAGKFTQYVTMPEDTLFARAEADDAFAQYIYGIQLIGQDLPDQTELSTKGMSYIQRAIMNGSPEAAYWLASFHLEMGTETASQDLMDKGIVHLEAATLSGSFEAAISLGYLYFQPSPIHDPLKATQLWKNAIRHEGLQQGENAVRVQSALCSNLSKLFSMGAYGHAANGEMAAQLHVLSYEKFVSPQQQKNVLNMLSVMAADKPELFSRIRKAGVGLPEISELTLLTNDEEDLSGDRRKRRIDICNQLLSVRIYDKDIRKDVAAYARHKLPSEISSVLNPALDF